MSVTISAQKRCSFRLYLKLFVGGCISYLCYLSFLAHLFVLHMMCCVCALPVFVWLPVSLDYPFLIALWYSLILIDIYMTAHFSDMEQSI